MMHFTFSVRSLSGILFFIFSTIVIFQTTAQSQEINSYLQKTRRNFGKPDSLNHYGDLLIAFKDSTAQAEGYLAKAQAMRTVNNMDSTLYFLKKGEEKVPVANVRLQGRIVRLSTSAYLGSRKFKEGLEEATRLEQIAIKSNDERLRANALSMKSRAQDGLTNFEAAIENVLEAARIQEKTDPRPLVNTYSQIATTYAHMGQPELATPWFQKALSQARKDGNSRFEINALNNMASHYLRLKNTDSSTFYYKKLLEKEAQLNPFQKMGAYISITRINIEANKVKEAVVSLNKAKALKIPGKRSNHKLSILSLEQRILRKKSDYDNALVLIDSAINMSGNGEINQVNYPFLLEKATLYEEKQDYKKALATFNRYTSIKDSISKNIDLAVIQNSADLFQLEEKEADLKVALAENENSKSRIVTLSIIVVLIIIVLAFVYKRYRNSKTREQELEKQNLAILVSIQKLQEQLQDNKKPDAPDSILLNSKQVVKLDQLEYVKSEGHYLDYHLEGEQLPLTDRSALKDRINELETSGFLQVHRSYVINIDKVRAVHSGMIIMETGNKIPLSRTYKQRLKEEDHPLFT